MKNITLKLFPILLGLLFTFPIIKESFSSFTVILLCVNTLLYKIASKDYSLPKPQIWLLTIPFWIILLRSAFSIDFNESGKHIQHATFFLFIPIFFSMIPAEFFDRKRLERYFAILKLTCLAIAIIYVVSFFMINPFGAFFIVFQNVSSFRNYVYGEFDWFVIHTTYYTIILVFGAAHALHRVLREKKYYELVYVVAFLLICFLLLTRLTIVLLVLALFVVLLNEKTISRKRKFVLSGSVIVLSVGMAWFTPGIKDRFVEIYKSFNRPPKQMNYDSTNIRRAIFDCSVALSKDDFWGGVGFDQLQKKLNGCYAGNYDSAFYTSVTYMTHDYYFYILLSSGIFGLLCYLIYLVFVIRTVWRSQLLLFRLFLVSILIVCFFEDFFYRHHGILYYNLLLICYMRHAQNKDLQQQQIT